MVAVHLKETGMLIPMLKIYTKLHYSNNLREISVTRVSQVDHPNAASMKINHKRRKISQTKCMDNQSITKSNEHTQYSG